MEGTGDIFLPSVSPTTSSTFCLKSNPQFVDNYFALSTLSNLSLLSKINCGDNLETLENVPTLQVTIYSKYFPNA